MSHQYTKYRNYHTEDFDEHNARERPRRGPSQYPQYGPSQHPHAHPPRSQHPHNVHGSHMTRSSHRGDPNYRRHRQHHPSSQHVHGTVGSPRSNLQARGYPRHHDGMHMREAPSLHARPPSMHNRPIHGSHVPSNPSATSRVPSVGSGPSGSSQTGSSGGMGVSVPLDHRGGPSSSSGHGQTTRSEDISKLKTFVQLLTVPDRRETSLAHLSKRRESFPDLAPMLWHAKAVVACLLQEVIAVYPNLTNPSGNGVASGNRCCNALALLQCIASHPETRRYFLAAYIPLFLYPFLNTDNTARSHEYLRLTSLGVIGALVKNPHPPPRDDQTVISDSDVVQFLLKTEIIPLCLRIMENSSGLSKTVATFIVQKILLDEAGLGYVCATAERFYTVSNVFQSMVNDEVNKSGSNGQRPSKRLLKHIVRCYLRLTEDRRAKIALAEVLPKPLRDKAFDDHFTDDQQTLGWLQKLRATLANAPSQRQSSSTRS